MRTATTKISMLLVLLTIAINSSFAQPISNNNPTTTTTNDESNIISASQLLTDNGNEDLDTLMEFDDIIELELTSPTTNEEQLPSSITTTSSPQPTQSSSTTPSTYNPTISPSTSTPTHQPTISHSPSTSPTISSSPSNSPTISFHPTSLPSSFPTNTPTISHAPSSSPTTSLIPSFLPSSSPTYSPIIAPSSMPSLIESVEKGGVYIQRLLIGSARSLTLDEVARFQLVYEKYTKKFGYETTQVDGICNVLSQQIGINQVIIGSDSSSSTQWMNNINAARNGNGDNRRRRRNSSKRDSEAAPWNDRELRQEELLGPQLPLQEKQPLRGYPLTLRFSIQYSTRIGIYDISTYNQLFTEYVNSNLNKVVQDLTLLNLPVVNAEAVLLLKDRSPTNKPTSKSPTSEPTVYSTSMPTIGSTSILPTSLPSDMPLDWDENFNMVTEKVTNNSFVLGLSLGLAGAFMISALGLLWYKKMEKHHRRGSSDSERSGAFPSSGDRGRRGQRPLSPTQQLVRSLSPQNLMRTLSPHSIGYGLPYFNHPSSTRGDGGSSVGGRSKGTIDLTPVEDTSPTETEAEISPEEMACAGFVASPRFMTSPRHNSGDANANAFEAAQQQQLHTQTSLSPLQREDIEYLTSPPRQQSASEKRSSPPRFFSSLAFSSAGNGTMHSSSTTTGSPGDSPMVGTMSQIERHHLWQQQQYQLQLQHQAQYNVDIDESESRDVEQQQGDRQLHVEVNHPPPPPEAIISPYDTPYAEEMRKKMYELNPSTSLSPTDTEQSDNYKNLFSLNYDSDAGSLSPGPNARRASLASMPSDRHWFSKVESESSLLPASPGQQTPHQTPQQPPRETPNSMPSGGHWYRPPTAEGSSQQSTPQRSPHRSPQRSPPPSQQLHHPQANSPQYLGSISRSSTQHRSAMFPLAEYEINNMIHNGSFSSQDDVVSIPEDNRSHHTHHTAESIFDGALDHDSHDELDNYKNQDVEVFRSAIEESVDGVEGMLSLAMTRALTSPDASFELPWAEYVTLQTTNRLPVVDDNKNIIEACCLCETYDWLKRHERSSMDSVNEYFQDILNRLVTTVIIGMMPPLQGASLAYNIATILGLDLLQELPQKTLIVTGMRKTNDLIRGHDFLVTAFTPFGDIEEAAIAPSNRGFGFVRFIEPEGVKHALKKYREFEIEIQDVSIAIKTPKPERH